MIQSRLWREPSCPSTSTYLRWRNQTMLLIPCTRPYNRLLRRPYSTKSPLPTGPRASPGLGLSGWDATPAFGARASKSQTLVAPAGRPAKPPPPPLPTPGHTGPLTKGDASWGSSTFSRPKELRPTHDRPGQGGSTVVWGGGRGMARNNPAQRRLDLKTPARPPQPTPSEVPSEVTASNPPSRAPPPSSPGPALPSSSTPAFAPLQAQPSSSFSPGPPSSTWAAPAFGQRQAQPSEWASTASPPAPTTTPRTSPTQPVEDSGLKWDDLAFDAPPTKEPKVHAPAPISRSQFKVQTFTDSSGRSYETPAFAQQASQSSTRNLFREIVPKPFSPARKTGREQPSSDLDNSEFDDMLKAAKAQDVGQAGIRKHTAEANLPHPEWGMLKKKPKAEATAPLGPTKSAQPKPGDPFWDTFGPNKQPDKQASERQQFWDDAAQQENKNQVQPLRPVQPVRVKRVPEAPPPPPKDIVIRRGNEKVPREKKEKSRRRNRNDEDDNEADYDPEYEKERRRLLKEQKLAKKMAKGPPPITVPEYISVSDLASAIHIKKDDLIIQLGEWGFEGTTQDTIMTGETAGLVALEYGFDPTVETGESRDLKARPAPEDPSKLDHRPPVVTIMGHVDHGKTTILDYLRKSSVAAQEHGGITQHIGAFVVKLSSGKTITFLDTPGHAAFLNMRQRGANVTDIIVLVVAADDGIMPQTLEALKHARNAKVPIIVAINKIDKYEADIERVKQDLGRHDVQLEEYGGDVQVVPVSGKTGKGMDDLEENIMLLSEIMDIRGDPEGAAEGWVLESDMKAVGKAATILVKRGTLRIGDIIVAGKTLARIRGLRNEAGKNVDEAGPGTPVEVTGWREIPQAGDEVLQAPNEQKARMAISYRMDLESRSKASAEVVRAAQKKEEKEKADAVKAAKAKAEAEAEILRLDMERPVGEELHAKDPNEKAERKGKKGARPPKAREVEEVEEGPIQVNFIVRGDVAGSVEAVQTAVQEIGNNEIRARILRTGIGPPSEGDVEMAATTKSHIISFNVAVPGNIGWAAQQGGVELLEHSIIYHLVDHVKKVVEARLPPRMTQKILGEGEVLKVFRINLRQRVFQNVGGTRVTNGVLRLGMRAKVLRGKGGDGGKGEVVYDGKVDTVKQHKKDVTEMKKGHECGVGFKDWDELEEGDHVQTYEEVREKRYL